MFLYICNFLEILMLDTKLRDNIEKRYPTCLRQMVTQSDITKSIIPTLFEM